MQQGVELWKAGDLDGYGKLVFESGRSSIENYEDMRHKVSRTLKKLVADLPDPEITEE